MTHALSQVPELQHCTEKSETCRHPPGTATSLLGAHTAIASSEPRTSGLRGAIWGEKKQLLLKQLSPPRAGLGAEPPIHFGRPEALELSTSYFKTPLFFLVSWEANNLHRRACIRVLPQQTSQGKKKKKKTKRSFFPAPLRQHHTSPRMPSTQFIFLPIKVSPPAWLWETQFMLRALGILFLAGTEKGSQRGGGSGSRTSRSLVSRRQRRAGTGSPRADRKSAAPLPRPPRATAGPARNGDGATAMGGLGGLRRCQGRGREGGCCGAGAPGQCVALDGAMGTSRASQDNGSNGSSMPQGRQAQPHDMEPRSTSRA